MEAISATPDYQSNTDRPMKETIILAFAFVCVFSPFQALQNLQSSLNQEHGLGVTSLACVYGGMFLVSFVTPALVYNLGIKAAILVAWAGHTLYVVCNFYPSWMTLIPGSLMLGLISCPLWTSTETYLSSLSRKAAELELSKNPKKPTTLHAQFSRLNGIFSSIFTASQFIGNLVSSTILFQSSYNDTATHPSYEMAFPCGAEYCPREGEGQHIDPPQQHIVYIMLGVFLVSDVVGLSITAKFLTNLVQPQYTGREIRRKLKSYWVAFKQPMMWLLIPLTASRGLIFTIHIGLFTEAYVSCSLGIKMVGYVMALWGLTTMASSSLLGLAARFTGRQFLIGVASVVDMVILVTLLLWRPQSGHWAAFLCLAVLMGLVDGIWMVQINALIAVLFASIVDSAFAVRGTWGSLSVSSSWLMATFLCPVTRIYTAIGLLLTGLVGYVAVEVLHRRSLRLFNRDEHEYVLLSNNDQPPDFEDDSDCRENDTTEETVFDARTETSRGRKTEAAMLNTPAGQAGAVPRDDTLNEGEELSTLRDGGVGMRLADGAGTRVEDTVGASFPQGKVQGAVSREEGETEETFFDAEAETRVDARTGGHVSNGDI
ncbi:hypothetical protein BaRGS_00032340 [Batillaria attramentaria]|uniref:Uncharacterized protein n=1 Tax=Batillaria attramentaria TaxID=370345 RepID=A0ABD0JP31_9CAEN